jgi:N-methylhydantoinase A
MDIEVLNWAVKVETEAFRPRPVSPDPAPRDCQPERQVSLFCDVTGQERSAGLVDRAELAPGDRLQGPVLIAEPQTTTFVAADFTARVDARGNLVLEREGA